MHTPDTVANADHSPALRPTVIHIEITGGGKSTAGAMLTEFLADKFEQVERHIQGERNPVDYLINEALPDAHPCYVGSRVLIVEHQGPPTPIGLDIR